LSGRSRSGNNLLRKVGAAIVLLPLAAVIVGFAVANRQRVALSFDPFASGPDVAFATRPLPLFLLLLAALILGVVIGGSASWLRHGRWRRTARRLDRDLARLREELERHKHPAGSTPTNIPPAVAPPERLRLRPPAV
jgi:uncharacterized integral membrane protein